MKNTGRQIGLALALAVGGLLTGASPLCGQELRTLTGSVTTGYEGLRQDGMTYSSPFLGLGGNLVGSWRDPRVLSFAVQPNLMVGHHFLGPLMGPAGNGVNAQTTFLGGSRMPLSVSYSYQTLGLPTFITTTENGTWPGATTIQRSLSIDWSTRFRQWPSFSIHYARNRNTIEAPFQLQQDTELKNQYLDMSTTYSIAKWDLEGRFTNNNSTNPYLGDGSLFPDDRNHERVYAFSASRPLPLHSLLLIDASHQNYDLRSVGQDYKTAYTRLYARWRSAMTKRVTLNVDTAYLSSLGDYLRKQALVGPGSGTTTPGLLSTEVSTLSTSGGVEVHIATGLTAHGEANKTIGLSQIGNLRGISANGFGGGLAYSHTLFRGQFSGNYSYTSLTSNGLVEQKTNQHNVSAFYSRRLPAAFRLTTSGYYTDGNVVYQFTFPTNMYGGAVELSRPLTARWTLSGRFDLRKYTYTYPVKNSSLTKGFGISISSQKLQAGISHHLDSGLAYRFGSGIIFSSNSLASLASDGLPPLLLTAGDSTNVDATYRPLKKMRIVGQWSRYDRSLSTGERTGMRSLDVRVEYDFRKLRASAGYMQHTQETGTALLKAWSGKVFYMQITRIFRVF